MRDVKIYRFFSYKLKYLNEISMLNVYEEWKNMETLGKVTEKRINRAFDSPIKCFLSCKSLTHKTKLFSN